MSSPCLPGSITSSPSNEQTADRGTAGRHGGTTPSAAAAGQTTGGPCRNGQPSSTGTTTPGRRCSDDRQPRRRGLRDLRLPHDEPPHHHLPRRHHPDLRRLRTLPRRRPPLAALRRRLHQLGRLPAALTPPTTPEMRMSRTAFTLGALAG